MTGERSVDVAAASGTLHVALLGGFSVRVGSSEVPGSWRLRKSKTLVKLLALAGGIRGQPRMGPRYAGLDDQVRDRPDICQLHRRGGRG
jgi:hypothetical protein